MPAGFPAGLLCELGSDPGAAGPPVLVDDLPATVARYEQRVPGVRWVWPTSAGLYPALLRAGVRVARCHDVTLTHGLLAGRDGSSAASAPELPALHAVLADTSPPLGQAELFGPPDEPGWPDRAPRPDHPGPPDHPDRLRGPALEAIRTGLANLVTVHADQQRRISADADARRFGLLVAAESAGGLAAAEMSFAGIPWRADVHDELLTGLLGARPPGGAQFARPRRLTELAGQIAGQLGGRPVNPDSPAQLTRALAAAGIRVGSTRSSELRRIDHPVIPLLLEYKELARLHAAHGWAWLDTWVSGGRFRPEYVVGGVVSGRWASRGGGALQIPRVLRRAVVADPGWVLVVADAAQLEPRVLAALAGDDAFAEAAAGGDLYAALADAFGGDRAKAKVALLSAMYGGAGGEAGQLLAVLRRRFPRAAGYVEAAARAGEEGQVVRSVLGRTCPAPSAAWRAVTEESPTPDAPRDPGAARAARARGRFTRNFVVQASAAEWALVLLACLRPRLAAMTVQNGFRAASASRGLADDLAGRWDPDRPHLVFFQHDEVIVHCPAPLAGLVASATAEAAAEAGRLVFGDTPVQFPMSTSVVGCYADAK